MLLRLAYLGLTNTFALLRLIPMSNRAKDIEILALRHQIRVLQWQLGDTAGARVMDGIALLEYLLDGGHVAADHIGADPADTAPLDTLADELRDWFTTLVLPPGVPERDAWLPSRLEYSFGCAAPQGDIDAVMRADEYHQGRLEWYALEHHPEQARLGDTPHPAQPSERVVHTFMPASIDGTPDTRWWSFEDRRTNFGDVRPDYHRPRQAAAHGVRTRVRERLVRAAVHAADRHRYRRQGHRADERVRRAHLDRAAARAVERGFRLLEPVQPEHAARERGHATARAARADADHAQGAAEHGTGAGGACARRDGQHDVGRGAAGAAPVRHAEGRARGRP